MLQNSFKNLETIINAASEPILVYVVAGNCDDHVSLEEEELAKIIHESGLSYIRFCYDESKMPFPRILDHTLYYFVPRNQTPIFWRNPIPAFTFREDIEIVRKVMNGMSLEEAQYDEASRQLVKDTEQLLKSERDKKFPPAFTRMRNFAIDMWESAKLGMRHLPVLVPAEKAFERLSICHGCEFFDAETDKCLKCGCNMAIKTNLSVSKCPIGKW